MYCSAACGITDDEENSYIVTGGQESRATNRVVKYDKNGNFTVLPSLNIPRYLHGCGTYRNKNNQKVK